MYQIIALLSTFICGTIVSWLCIGYINRRKNNKKIEFKKLLVIAVILTYFVGVIIGSYVVMFLDPSQLMPLLTFIGTPTTSAILCYCWVVKTENAIKLKQRFPNDVSQNKIDLNSITI